VTGDNGTNKSLTSMMGDVVIKGGKGSPTDAGTRVALVGYQPGTIPKGVVTDRLVEFSDFMPTIAKASGASAPQDHDGVSFLAALHGNESEPRDPIYIYYWPRPERGQPTRFARDQRWKLYGDGRLVDVQSDVFEKTTLSGHVEIRKRLQGVLDRMPAEGQTLLNFD